jgi:hypothetical protein
MVLRNFVVLEDGVPAVLHFRSGQIVTKDIVDPLTGVEKRVRALELVADRVGGVETETSFSVTSEKLAATLMPFVERGLLGSTTFVITKRGSSFRTEYEVQTLPA